MKLHWHDLVGGPQAFHYYVQSIYSPLYASDRGLLVFDQIPWFKVAERLESEKEMMLEERRRFQEMLNQQQVCGYACSRWRMLGRNASNATHCQASQLR
eukprot:1161956-Pelagomonas_calceolata.AAC.17